MHTYTYVGNFWAHYREYGKTFWNEKFELLDSMQYKKKYNLNYIRKRGPKFKENFFKIKKN